MKKQELEERLLKIEQALKIASMGEVNSPVVEPVVKKEKTKRAPSAYNLFMKDELARLKKEQGADFDRKTAFKVVAKSWSEKKVSASDKTDGWFG
jgi:hypothetical protein